MKKLLFFALFTSIGFLAIGQKIASDGFVVEYKKYEITEQNVPLLGKQKMIMGNVIIKNEKKKVATHDFLVPIMKDEITHIAVLDSKGEKIFPRLHYVADEKFFTYYEGTDKE